MPDVRSFFDKDFIYSYNLEGRDVTVEIVRVKGGELRNGKTATKKPVVWFKGSEKGLALNITNVRTIASLFGSFKSEDWIGKRITLYPTTTTFGSATVDCIRIRNVKPTGAAKAINDAVPPPVAPDDPITASDIAGFGGGK